jgi:hypothetical protein
LGAGMAITLEDFGGHRPEKIAKNLKKSLLLFSKI